MQKSLFHTFGILDTYIGMYWTATGFDYITLMSRLGLHY